MYLSIIKSAKIILQPKRFCLYFITNDNTFLLKSQYFNINIVLNYFLIPVLGIEGASIGTIVGYVISVLLCVIVLVKMELLKIDWKIIFIFIIFTCSFVTMRIFNFNTWYVNLAICLAFTIIAILVYYKDIGKLVMMVKGLLKKKDEDQVNDKE